MQTLPPDSVLYVGLRADEEERRGIYGEDIAIRFPFREWGWRLEQVQHYLTTSGVRIPRRTDCGFCFYQRIIEWRNLWRDNPEVYARGIAIEERHGHTFRSPGRDTWPVSLRELGDAFASGRKIRGEREGGDEPCRVCTL